MRNRNLERCLCLAALAAVSGCATVAPPVTVGDQDTYRLSVSGAPYESQASTNSKAFSAANDYCGGMGKQMLFRHSTESGEHSFSPKQEDLVFVCTDPNQPAYLRASVSRRDQEVVAKQ